MELHRNLKPWPPGVSGNPNGRPVGSRSAFSAGFTRDLAEVWADKGKAAMLYTAEKQPAVFFATCARLIGPEVKLTIEQSLPGNRDGSRYAYRLTTKGVQVALLFLFFHKRLCGPIANSRFHYRPDPHYPPNSRLEAAYHRVDKAIQRIVDVLAAA